MEQLKFNTAIAALIDLNNEMVGWATIPRAVAAPFVLMLAPLAPHLAEELWRGLGHEASLAYEAWPRWDEGLATDAQIQMAVQVMGKLRTASPCRLTPTSRRPRRRPWPISRSGPPSRARRSAESSWCRASS